jgi:hypothetical protein
MIPIRLGRLGRGLGACVVSGAGIAIGWTLTSGQSTTADWLLPVLTLASALLLALDVFWTTGRRTLWIAILCGTIAGRAVYELARLILHR